MPDLLTHALTSHALYRLASTRLEHWLVLTGAMLPDLVAWLPMKIVPRLIDFGLPSEAQRYFPPMHSFALVGLWCAFLSLLFVERMRVRAFQSLVAGSLLHLGLDLFQGKFDGGYLALYPFSFERVQIPLVPQDDWYGWIPAACLAAAVTELCHRRSRRPA